MNKIIFLLSVIATFVSCKAQTYPLKSHVPTPDGAYLKDMDNSLSDFVGTWKGQWNGKILYVYFDKLINNYMEGSNQYRDMLIGRFKTTEVNGNILFDNTNLPNEDVKIKGMRFRKPDDTKYSLSYGDSDLCGRAGTILINFTDSTKTKLQWKYSQSENFIFPDCWYFGATPANTPQPLPSNIVLVKQ